MSYNLTTKGHKYCIVVGIICNRSFKTIRYNTMSFILINNMSEKLQDAHIKSNTTFMIQSDRNCPRSKIVSYSKVQNKSYIRHSVHINALVYIFVPKLLFEQYYLKLSRLIFLMISLETYRKLDSIKIIFGDFTRVLMYA